MSDELYLEYFGLREPPFALSPDHELLYLSTQHGLAQAYLNYALLNRDSFVVITGETGSGKTTLINRLMAEIGEHMVAAHITQTQVTPVQFLQSLLLEFGFKPFDKKKIELLDLVKRFLIEQHGKHRQIVLIIDDAHNLSEKVLEEIRLITEVDSVKGGVMNVILCGQPLLLEKLDAQGMEPFAQRIRFRFHINALSQFETTEYIEQRLSAAGADTSGIFAPEAVSIVYRYTGGIPRLINVLCDTALTGAFAEDQQVVDVQAVECAIDELDWVPFDQRHRPAAPPSAAAAPPAEAPAVPSNVESLVMRGKLVLTVDGQQLRDFTIGDDRLMIGRDRDNEICIPAEFVSRHHAQVNWTRSACWITDLNSTNGTYVNGRRVNKRMLRDGDAIQLGKHRLTYLNPNAAREAVAETQVDRWRETTVLPVDDDRTRIGKL